MKLSHGESIVVWCLIEFCLMIGPCLMVRFDEFANDFHSEMHESFLSSAVPKSWSLVVAPPKKYEWTRRKPQVEWLSFPWLLSPDSNLNLIQKIRQHQQLPSTTALSATFHSSVGPVGDGARVTEMTTSSVDVVGLCAHEETIVDAAFSGIHLAHPGTTRSRWSDGRWSSARCIWGNGCVTDLWPHM